MKTKVLLFIFFVLLLFSRCESLPSNPFSSDRISNHVVDWRDEVIYQLMIDRFADGDNSNNFNVDLSSPGAYHGGDFQGVIDKIPYLKELGVTTLWISPVVQNVETDAGYWSYHGYWAQDFTKVNKHFGSMAKLREMIDECHNNGIKVILDIVCNHVGQLFYYDINDNGQPDIIISGQGNTSELTRVTEYDPDFNSNGIQDISGAPAQLRWFYSPEINRMPPKPDEFANPLWYYRKGRITDYTIEDQVTTGDFPGGLKDVNTTRPDVREGFINAYLEWIKTCNFDGFRIDTVKHVEHGFWQTFCPEIRKRAKALGKENFFMFGEVFDGNDSSYGSYTNNNELDSLFYFSQKFELDGCYGTPSNTINLETIYKHRIPDTTMTPGYYGDWYGITPHADGIPLAPYQCMVNFLDNHDVERFLQWKSIEQLHHALMFIFLTDGVPCIYNGTEQNYKSGSDPVNRKDLWDYGYDTSNSTFQMIKNLAKLKQDNIVLRRGSLSVKWSSNTAGNQDEGIFAFERYYDSNGDGIYSNNEKLLVVLNFHSTATRITSASFNNDMQTTFPVGTKLVNIFPNVIGGDESTTTFSGTSIVSPNMSFVSANVPPLGCKVYQASE